MTVNSAESLNLLLAVNLSRVAVTFRTHDCLLHLKMAEKWRMSIITGVSKDKKPTCHVQRTGLTV